MRKKLYQIAALILAFVLILTSANIPEASAAEKNGSYITVSKSIYRITKVPSGVKSGEAVLMKWGGSKTAASVKEKIIYKKKVYKIIGIAGTYKGKKKAKSVFGASVKKVTLPDTITLIGENTFSGCKKLTSLTIPKSVEKVEKKAVNNCPTLKKITLKSRDITFPASGAFTKASKKAVVYIPTGLTAKDTYKTKVKKQLTAGGQVKYNLSKPEVKAIEKGELLENKSVQKNKITLKGVAFSNSGIKKLTYQITDEAGKKIASGGCKGTTSWTLSCALKGGTNAIQITAEDGTGKKGSSTVYVVKVDKQVSYDESVKVESTETSQEAAESITDIAQQGDSVYVTVKNDSEILSYVEDGTLKKGDVYLLQPSDEMPMGFAGIFEGVKEERGKKVIQFTPATMEDIYKDDVTIDLSGEIDPKNPVACAYLPDGTTIDVAGDGNQTKESGNAKLNAKTDTKLSLFDNIKLSKKNGKYELEIGFEDFILYDSDSDDETTEDQLKLNGDYTISNFQTDFYFKNKGLSIQQCYNKVSFSGSSNVELEIGGKLDVKETVKLLNDNFDNKRTHGFIELEGIDLSDSIMLGVVGFHVATMTPVVTTFHTLQKTSERTFIDPVVFMSFIVHVDGTLSVKATLGYNETSYNEKGFNLQKKGYIGKYGAFDPSLGKSKKIFGYNFQTIDRTGKSKKDMSKAAERTLYVEGESEQSVKFGLGILGAMMMDSFIPAGFSAYPYFKIEGKENGRLEIELPMEGIKSTGEYYVKMETGIEAKVAYSMTKKIKGSLKVNTVLWEKYLEGKPEEDDSEEPEKPDDKTDTTQPEQPESPNDGSMMSDGEFDPAKVPYTISAGQTCTFETYKNRIGSLWGYNLLGNSAIFEKIWLDENGVVIKQNLYVGSPILGEWRSANDVNGKTIIKVYFGTVTVDYFTVNRAVPIKITGTIESGGKTMENPLRLNRNKVKLKIGKKFLLQAESGMEEYKLYLSGLRFKSSNYKIADVNTTGTITAHSKGTAKITVTANGGFQAVCTVIVK